MARMTKEKNRFERYELVAWINQHFFDSHAYPQWINEEVCDFGDVDVIDVATMRFIKERDVSYDEYSEWLDEAIDSYHKDKPQISLQEWIARKRQ